MMHVPTLADRQFEFERYFFSDADLPAVDRQLVILATVREWDARFAWARHEARAREVNLRPQVIETLRTSGALDGLTPREQTLIELVRTLLRTREVPDELYQRALDELGAKQLVEVIGLIGNYLARGLYIKAFAITEDSPTFQSPVDSDRRTPCSATCGARKMTRRRHPSPQQVPRRRSTSSDAEYERLVSIGRLSQ
jgi:4-carboxymuconolactone decarboxylase